VWIQFTEIETWFALAHLLRLSLKETLGLFRKH
jgi:hypothetical protein